MGYKCHAFISYFTLCLAAALVAAGLLSSAMSFPEGLTSGTAEQRETVKDIAHVVMWQSVLPGAVTFVTCLLGFFGGLCQINCMLMTHMIFAIIMSIWHVVGLTIPLVAAAGFSLACTAIQSDCQQEGADCNGDELAEIESYCSRTTTVLWAAVILGAACAIFSIVLSITPCGIVCCTEKPKEPTYAAMPAGRAV